MTVRIACISDTHMWAMPLKDLPEADILLHAGDATYRGTVQEVTSFAKEIGKHLKDSKHKPGYKKIIFVPGNHDWLFEKDEQLGRRIMNDAGVEVLINESTEFERLKIWGSPVTPPFHNWAFNWDPSKRLYLWEQIPEGTDIVITHGPPMFILDEVPEYDKIRHTGCSHLANRLLKIKPQLHLFGHIHEGFGETVKQGIRYVNASFMDGRYQPNNFARIVEL